MVGAVLKALPSGGGSPAAQATERRRWLGRAAALAAAASSSLIPGLPDAGMPDARHGRHVTPTDHPTPPGARLPRLALTLDAHPVLSWVEGDGAGHRLVYAVHRGGHWKAPVSVARGTDWFLNWADFPSVVPIDDSFWAAHWLVRRNGGSGHDYDIALSVSRDGGQSWSATFVPYTDPRPAEHGFVTLFAHGHDAGLVWLDGREYARSPEAARAAGVSGRFALRFTTVSREGVAAADIALDGDVCTCCQTSVARVAGTTVVAYRGRTAQQIRDNRTVRYSAGRWVGGPTLGPDGWRTAACPVNGPALAARGDALVAAWFTGAGERGRVRASLSRDGGAQFGRSIDLDVRDPVGRVAATWLDEQHAAIAWIGAPDRHGAAALMCCRLSRDGRLDRPRRIVEVSAERHTGFPQLIGSQGRLLAAWTVAGDRPGVRSAWIEFG